MIESAIILAAGLGSRLGLSYPKCLIKVEGKTLLRHQLESLQSVPRITIATGYKRELIEAEIRCFPQAIQKRITTTYNEQYMSTSNVFTLSRVTPEITIPTLVMMSDLLITPPSFERFLHACQAGESRVAVSDAKSRDAIYAAINNAQQVIEISRQKPTDHEWVGMVYVNQLKIDITKQFVYQLVDPQLPMQSMRIESWEFDTPQDMEFIDKIHTVNS